MVENPVVAVLTVLVATQLSCEGVKGEQTVVSKHYEFDKKSSFQSYKDFVVPKSKTVFTTEKDFKIKQKTSSIQVNITKQVLDYNTKPEIQTSKSGRKYIKNSPSKATLRESGISQLDWTNDSILVKKFDFKGSQHLTEKLSPAKVARLLMYATDVADTISENARFSIEIL